MICKDCGEEVNKATVDINDILSHPDITLSVDYWLEESHRKECNA